MISFSSKPRTHRPRVAGRADTESGYGSEVRSGQRSANASGMAPLSAGEPVREDEVDDLERLAEVVAQRRGWYDSSMELRRGLEIVEEIAPDTLPDDLRDSLFGKLS